MPFHCQNQRQKSLEVSEDTLGIGWLSTATGSNKPILRKRQLKCNEIVERKIELCSLYRNSRHCSNGTSAKTPARVHDVSLTRKQWIKEIGNRATTFNENLLQPLQMSQDSFRHLYYLEAIDKYFGVQETGQAHTDVLPVDTEIGR